MDDSGSILFQISTLKDMLDKVNDEIEANIQITRRIESDIVKCSEIETALATRESELLKLVYLSQFELCGLIAVTVNSRNSVAHLMEEISHLRRKKEELSETLNKNRETFTVACSQFQGSIEGEQCNELRALLSEKESLEDEIYKLEQTHTNLKNSASERSMKILQDLHSSNSGLEAEIQRGNAENEQLVKQIAELRATLLSTVDQW
ncbi:hypothetical protein RND81_02G043500 [Saponaria officinalis]|uniref:Uncharacterized protein n=1 Tax=Saponaria officinalis TaxID=3572 RepID=A0AAW1MQX2_SAPOF